MNDGPKISESAMSRSKRKQAIIRILDTAQVFRLGSGIQRICFGSAHVRAIYYHGTPQEWAANLERQLRFYSRHFEPVDRAGLEDLLAGSRRSRKPGLLISFDDGLLSNYEIAAPLLEKYGFVGWFFVPVALIGDPGLADDAEHQERIRSRYVIDVSGEAPGKPSFMSWEQVRDLDRRHVVGCHTMNHCRLYETLSEAQLRLEILESKAELEERLGHEVDTFCWVGGEEGTYSRRAAEWVVKAGYRLSFMTRLHPITAGASRLQLQRTGIEGDWPMPQVRFYLSGVMDVAYTRKRRRVERLMRTG